MTRREPVTFYVSDSEKEEIKREAERDDKTISNYARDLIQQKRRENAQEEFSDTLDAERRIEQLIAQGTDDMEEIALDIRAQNRAILDALDDLYDVELERLDRDLEDIDNGDPDTGTENENDLQDRLRGGNDRG